MTTRLGVILASLAIVASPLAANPAHASTPQVAMSSFCNNGADVTDNGHDVWILCQGLSSALSNVVQIDANSGKIVHNVASPSGVYLPDEIVSTDHYVWTIDAPDSGNNIAQYAAPSGKLVRLIHGLSVSVTQPAAMASTANGLWNADGG
jgi:hypothetical protein